jgi:hypothetical protein
MREPTASSCPREIVDRRAFSFRLQKRDKPRSIFTIAERSSMATPLDVVFAQIQPARAQSFLRGGSLYFALIRTKFFRDKRRLYTE